MAREAGGAACLARKVVVIVTGLGVLFILLSFYKQGVFEGNDCKEIIRTVTVVREITVTSAVVEDEEHAINLTTRKTLYHIPGLDLYLYTAFLDERYHENIVRVFGLQKKDAKLPDFICRWRKSSGTVDVPAKKFLVDASWPQWTDYYACNYDCNFNKTAQPYTIDLTTSDEQYSYTVDVERTVYRKNRKPLALCVKPVTGSFITPRLVEWFEAQRAAGVKDILLYTTDVLGTSQFVVQYYKDLGLVKTFSFPYLMRILQMLDSTDMEGHLRYALYQQVYLIAMQDCLYRFHGSYKHLLYLDLDEVLLPSPPHKDLEDMLVYLRKYYLSAAGFLFMTAWHFEDYGVTNDTSVPDYMYIARYPRATIPFMNQPKSIIVTDRAISVNFHTVLDVSDKKFSNEEMPWQSTAYLHHFRGLCIIKFEDYRCKDFEKSVTDDSVMPQYIQGLVKNTKIVLDKLMLN